MELLSGISCRHCELEKGVDEGEAAFLRFWSGLKIRKVNWVFKSILVCELHLLCLFFFLETCNTICRCIDCGNSACSNVTAMDGYNLADWNQRGDGGVSNVPCTVVEYRPPHVEMSIILERY